MKITDKLVEFLKEVRLEMKKVNWPTKEKTIRYTLIVLGVSVAVAMFLGSVDFVVTALLDKFVFYR